VASVSGGKDSAALSLWLTEQGIEHDRVFLDTDWERPATYEYLRGELTRVIGPITEVKAPKGMADLIRSKAMFPSRLIRFCTQSLKIEPMIDHLVNGWGSHACQQCGALGSKEDIEDECECGGDFAPRPTVNAVGIRHQESAARAGLPEWEYTEDFPVPIWRPLVRWTEAEVVAIHKRHGLKPNPLYLLGASRVGCWPCIYARKSEIRLLTEVDPSRVEVIRALEAEIARPAQERYERDRAAWLADPPPKPEDEWGATKWEHKRRRLEAPFSPPAWFQSQAPDRAGHYRMLPIDEVVRWARTSRGGRQYEMFGQDPDAGCMRWGMCDTGGAG